MPDGIRQPVRTAYSCGGSYGLRSAGEKADPKADKPPVTGPAPYSLFVSSAKAAAETPKHTKYSSQSLAAVNGLLRLDKTGTFRSSQLRRPPERAFPPFMPIRPAVARMSQRREKFRRRALEIVEFAQQTCGLFIKIASCSLPRGFLGFKDGVRLNAVGAAQQKMQPEHHSAGDQKKIVFFFTCSMGGPS